MTEGDNGDTDQMVKVSKRKQEFCILELDLTLGSLPSKQWSESFRILVVEVEIP